MGRQLWLSVGMLAAIAVTTAAWIRAEPGEGIRALLPVEEEAEEVMVLLVESRAGLAAVRGTVAPARIVVAGEDAFPLREGLVVATRLEAAGDALTRAGWVDRGIRIWAPQREASQRAAAKRGGAEGPAASRRARGGRVAAASDSVDLLDKDTLSASEALAAMRALEASS